MSLITIFLILLVAVFATVLYFTEPTDRDKRIQQRLGRLDRRVIGEEDEPGILKQVSFSRITWVDQFLRETKAALQLHVMLDQAQVPWTVGRFFFYSACLMLVGAVVGHWWIPIGFAGWIPGLTLGLAPLAWVQYKRWDRFRRFNLLLPDAIDLIARALRAGHSLPSAMVTVADEITDPLGPAFRQCADEMSFGLPFRDAMLNLYRRFPIPDLQFLVAAILIQKETGGNLPELLDKTAAVLRARIHLQQKVRVYTAQGRMTGAILLALPFVAFILLNLVRPGYTNPLFETETGKKLVYGTLISMTLGALVIRRIIKVKY